MTDAYVERKTCRVCGNKNLLPVLSLGEQALTGVFPATVEEKVPSGPLDLIWCRECGLLQMKESYNLDEMYGDNYGYRSGLNQSMVDHLNQKIRKLQAMAKLTEKDMVIDIGSNDATSLKAYTVRCERVGIDPTGRKFLKYYPEDVVLISDFFTARKFIDIFGEREAKIITSIAMFYDLEDPTTFVRDVSKILAPDGIWHFEQSYMPAMLQATAYDTVCHEHLEFYSFRVIKELLERCGMHIIDVDLNRINGGSIAITAANRHSPYIANGRMIDWLLTAERELKLDTPKPYMDFEERVYRHRDDLLFTINTLLAQGKTIFGYGASTKGNVMLQFCGLTSKQIPFIADVNPDKFGCFTPGTHIPIISEKHAKAMNPDYFLVFPWHFKDNILERENEWRNNGGKFIFPLPKIEIV